MKASLMILILLPATLVAQTTLTGTVKDIKGEPVPGANVFLLNTYDGSTVDGNGHFEFSTTESGPAIMVVKFVGYKDVRQQVELQGNRIEVSITLKEEINQLEAVTITAGSFAASDESRRTIFKALDIATTAGATADIAGALNTLPGTQKVGESGRLFVRGGDGSETRTFIDGMLVLDAYGAAAPNTPSRGRFLPFMFKGTSFSTGGYSAEYGQALSSALVLDSKDEENSTRTDIGLLSVGADVAHAQAWERGSVAGKIQYTNIRPYFGLINQEIDWKTPPASIEGSGAYRQRVGTQGMLKVYGNFNHNDFSLFNHDIDDPIKKSLIAIGNTYAYLNGFYRTEMNAKWALRSGFSYTGIDNKMGIDELQLTETDRGLHTKVVAEGSLSDKIELKTGAEIILRQYEAIVDTSTVALAFNEPISAVFAEADLYANSRFVTRLGGRLEYNNLSATAALDPRVSLAYKASKSGQFSLAYGRFRQSPRNEWLRVQPSLKAEEAEHFILNFQRIENNKTFRVEGYYKRYHNLVKFLKDDPGSFTNNGSGYARGIEVFWRDNATFKNIDYWISYSFLDTERDYLNTPYAVAPSFASAHNFSAVYKHYVSAIKTQVGVTWSFATGRPYNNPNENVFNGSRTKSYQDLSANLSYLPKPYLIIHFSCTNLLGRDNIFGYEFGNALNENSEFNARPIRQPAPRFVFLGIFITLSKDKLMNQLPSL